MRPLLALSRDLPLVAESGDKILLMVWSCFHVVGVGLVRRNRRRGRGLRSCHQQINM